jgi:hypothetical protein
VIPNTPIQPLSLDLATRRATEVQCGFCKAILPNRSAAVACYDSHARLPVKQFAHYCGDSASAEWLAAMREMETEGERTPIQAEPHEVVMSPYTPAFLRKQA